MDVPVTGIVGILGGGAGQVGAQLDLLKQETPCPDAVEIRADLFEDPSSAVEVLGQLPHWLRAIFTVRLSAHGGRYAGEETRRLALYRRALESGAALVDAEWESECARALAADGAPLVVSHHDFQGMPEPEALDEITARMAELGPLVIKLVPTAATSLDAVTMLQWVGSGSKDGPCRVGFAMGEAGVPSRVLSPAWGAPWTYAALGDAVAPGLLTVRDLAQTFRIGSLSRGTKLFGVLGPTAGGPSGLCPIAPCRVLNRALAARRVDAIFLPLRLEKLEDLTVPAAALPLEGVTVAGFFEAEALQLGLASGSATAAAAESGGADILLVRPGPGGAWTFAADHTRCESTSGVVEKSRRQLRLLTGLDLAEEELQALLGDEALL